MHFEVASVTEGFAVVVRNVWRVGTVYTFPMHPKLLSAGAGVKLGLHRLVAALVHRSWPEALRAQHHTVQKAV